MKLNKTMYVCALVLIGLFALVTIKFYPDVSKKLRPHIVDLLFPLDEMSPLPALASLCDNPQFSHYRSRETINDVSTARIWEKHYPINELPELIISKVNNYFDYEQFDPKIEWLDPQGNKITHYGFYDGDQRLVFRTRFDQPGLWQYRVIVNDVDIDSQRVSVRQAEVEENIVYPLRIDPENSQAFTAGGQPFYWVGGKWFSAQNMGLCYFDQYQHLRATHRTVDDEDYLRYLDYLVETKHNSYLHKIALFPLMDDGISWDLPWLQRIEWGIREALARGLYVQLNLFDTWARDSRYKVISSTSAAKQVFNVWEPDEQDLKLIKNYLRVLTARFSHYPNIFWELGNEMEHYPNCGKCFVEKANQYYLPWLRQFDPYGGLVGLSEKVWLSADVDVGFLHQTTAKAFAKKYDDPRPRVLNELVRSDNTDALWRDATMRDSGARLAFRRAYWRSLLLGVSGSFEATWLNVSKPLNASARHVMEDHQRVKEFIDSENLNVNQRKLGQPLASKGKYYIYSTEFAGGQRLFYFLTKNIKSKVDSWSVDVDISEMNGLSYSWFNPADGQYLESIEIEDGTLSKMHSFSMDSDAFDLVLLIRPL